MKIHPLDDRIFLRKKEVENVTKSGLFLPETIDQKPMEGTVIAVGPGKLDKSGDRIAPVVKVGDRVLFGNWSIKDMDVDGEEISVMREDDIIGILTEI